MTNLPIVILAGGKSSRFFPFNYSGHKGLIELHGSTLTDRLLESLAKNGFKDTICIHNPKTNPDQLRSIKAKAESLDLKISFILQKAAGGMGDALLQARHLLPKRFGVCSAYHKDAGEVLGKLCTLKTPIGLVAVETNNPEEYGVLSIHKKLATGIVEKPPANKAPSNYRVQSLYILSSEFLRMLENTSQEEYSFETALNKALGESPSEFIILNEPLTSLKYPWKLFDIQSELFDGKKTYISDNARIDKLARIDDHLGPVIIEDGASIGHATKIVGPAYIGKSVVVGDFSLIRGSSLESGVRVGAHADIARSIIFPNSSFHGFGFIGDSIIGNNVKIGAGFITANKRFDRESISLLVKQKKVSLPINHHGTMIGEHTNIGIRTSTMPGVYIGAHNTIMPHTIVSKHLAHEKC